MSGYTFRLFKLATILTLGAAGVVTAQVPALVEMLRFSPHETRVAAFRLDTPQAVQIEAVGADDRFPLSGAPRLVSRIFGRYASDQRSSHGWRGNAWIMDAISRKVVWELRTGPIEAGPDGIREFRGTVQLPAGQYEAYYASYSATRSDVSYRSESGNSGDVVRTSRHHDDGFSRNFLFRVRGSGTTYPEPARIVGASYQRNSVISLTGLKPGESRTAGFTLDKPTRLELYAVGEAQRGSPSDYGWIMNADTRERVWQLDWEHSLHGGGANKNRAARLVKVLPPGRYVAAYALDDSHDAGDWNAAPPWDPAFWGMTIRVVDPADRTVVKPFRYDPVPANAVVKMTGVGDDEQRTEGITVTRPVDVRIIALGEGRSSRMSDYGWIVDNSTHRRIWTMSYEDSEHAGGSSKNRLVSTTLHLEPGTYFVNYRTDDSHSYEEFNEARPMDAELWGMTVVPVNPEDADAFKPYDEAAADADVLVSLVGMLDNEDARATFTLDRAANVRIYAVGEGTGNEMHDYGFIEDRNTRQVVWEMTYRLTEHAGGAEKNRQFDGVVHLPAGSYVLRYRSDGSHSADGWNSPEPDDARNYGITLYRPSK